MSVYSWKSIEMDQGKVKNVMRELILRFSRMPERKRGEDLASGHSKRRKHRDQRRKETDEEREACLTPRRNR